MNNLKIDETIKNKIYTIRDLQVMLDRDLASLYGVETKHINQAVKRNFERFNELDFMFQLTDNEFKILKSQFVTSSWGGIRKRPYVFTEQGVYMLATVLKSSTAINVTKQIMRTFSQMKNILQNSSFIFQRFTRIEQRLFSYDEKIDKVFKALESKQPSTQSNGIFFNGQIFDSYNFISNLIRDAKKEIILIDNYIDDNTLNLFSKVPNIKVTIYTHTISKTLKKDLEKYNLQYSNIEIKIFKNSHDRFIILDNSELYNIGASLKDLGKKWFAFAKLDISLIKSILENLNNI